MEFNITLVGLNHRTASVDTRERFSLGNHCNETLWPLPATEAISESLILSTCNRVEILAVGPGKTEESLRQFWVDTVKNPLSELKACSYALHDLDAVRHVFEVAASLDSMILGEPQILGQFKEAYRKAHIYKKTGPILNKLMHRAFSVAKRVRNETAVAASAVSVSYAAVELSKRIFGTLPGHRALLIGAGEMAELAATHLLQGGIDEIVVVNRTFERGQELARRFHGAARHFEEITACLADADIVIASTGSENLILGVNEVRTALKARKNRPMFFIDIAVPRDIDPQINGFDNVYLYDIDDLKEVVEENLATRRDEAEKARLIIDDETKNFGNWLKLLDVKPSIVELVERGEQIARAELAKTLKKLGPVTPAQREALEKMTRSIVKKMNHYPLAYLHSATPAMHAARISLTREMFKLDKTD